MDGKVRILVFGFYFKNNLGDDLFIDAFRHLFPNLEFSFTDIITNDNLKSADAVFIGGGSLLNEDIIFSDPLLLNQLKEKKIFYIGVGSETDIHPTHQILIPLAKLVAIRNDIGYNKIIDYNKNTIIINDLVYCLPANFSTKKFNKSVLIIPNSLIVPSWDEPHWKHAAWNYFKSEFSQFLDDLVLENYHINFLPMSSDIKWNDGNTAIEIINGMKIKRNYLLDKRSFEETINLISQYSLVISQRYHGGVLSDIAGTPCLTLYHHDKLKYCNGQKLSYYGLTKDKLHEYFNLSLNSSSILPLEMNIFDRLIRSVNNLI